MPVAPVGGMVAWILTLFLFLASSKRCDPLRLTLPVHSDAIKPLASNPRVVSCVVCPPACVRLAATGCPGPQLATTHTPAPSKTQANDRLLITEPVLSDLPAVQAQGPSPPSLFLFGFLGNVPVAQSNAHRMTFPLG